MKKKRSSLPRTQLEAPRVLSVSATKAAPFWLKNFLNFRLRIFPDSKIRICSETLEAGWSETSGMSKFGFKLLTGLKNLVSKVLYSKLKVKTVLFYN